MRSESSLLWGLNRRFPSTLPTWLSRLSMPLLLAPNVWPSRRKSTHSPLMSPVHLLLAVVWAMSTPRPPSLLRKHGQLLMSVTMALFLAERRPRQLFTVCLALVCNRMVCLLTRRSSVCMAPLTSCSMCMLNGVAFLWLKLLVTCRGCLRGCDALK